MVHITKHHHGCFFVVGITGVPRIKKGAQAFMVRIAFGFKPNTPFTGIGVPPPTPGPDG